MQTGSAPSALVCAGSDARNDRSIAAVARHYQISRIDNGLYAHWLFRQFCQELQRLSKKASFSRPHGKLGKAVAALKVVQMSLIAMSLYWNHLLLRS